MWWAKVKSLLFIGKRSPVGLPSLNKLSWSVSGASLKSPRNQVEDSEGLAWTLNYGLEADYASLEILLSQGPLTTPGNVWVVSHFKVKKPGMMPKGHRAWNTNKRKWSMLAPWPQAGHNKKTPDAPLQMGPSCTCVVYWLISCLLLTFRDSVPWLNVETVQTHHQFGRLKVKHNYE